MGHIMFEILHYSFFQNALIGSLLASMLCALIGTYVVTRRLVFVGGGIAHASLGGVGMAAMLGFSPMVGAGIFSLFSGFSIQWLSRRGLAREDSAIALLWTFGMSIGVMCAYLTPGFMTDLPSYLFGNILSVSTVDIISLSVLTLVAGVFFLLRLRAIVTVAYDSDFARTQGLPVRLIENFLMALIALTIVCCLHIAGIVMVISLLSIPQMAASLFARTFGRMIWLSFAFGLLGCMGGLFVSFALNVPSGPSIILCSIVIYVLAKAIKSAISVLCRKKD